MPTLQFSIDLTTSQKIREWKAELDFTIIQYQIQNTGFANVYPAGATNARIPIRMETIRTISQIGEYEPFEGSLSAGISFTFHPIKGGCALEVKRFGCGYFDPYPTPFAPLTFTLDRKPMLLNDRSGAGVVGVRPRNWLMPAEEITFLIAPGAYERFTAWSRCRPLSDFDFTLIPSFLGGMYTRVHDRLKEDTLDLTSLGSKVVQVIQP